ncbi:response regulator transcription factor [Neptunomonas japonica]|uniref:Two-component system, chemotaxis family, response regulator CheY n=1 Tax=Neptunomonas japonica JAMM 1380 TaxID=1441457 RepID=A0A7R6PEK9_9GAMM|nr:response regulator [Neptunomonas japonica]BBB28058.1 two-component system, chemotaxis family, response regulator CheY [Neptunomonas japonica JAMM 1380]
MSNVLLIVDDSRVSRMILSKVFQSLVSDWIIIEAPNGQEAITLASEHQPSLVIMDLNMPVLNGLEAALIMKPQMATSTIIILTADIQASNKAKVNDLGVHFVEKPITEAVVQQALSFWRAEHD